MAHWIKWLYKKTRMMKLAACELSYKGVTYKWLAEIPFIKPGS